MRVIDNLDKKILVLGDSFLDEYITGTCNRISQEAPVPILEVKEGSRYVLGGAGNTAANIRSLGGNPTLISILGDDFAGRIFGDLSNGSIDLNRVNDGRITTRKIRVMAQGQQLLRMDYEDKKQLSEVHQTSVLGLLDRHIEKSSVVVLSDYAKGFFSPDFLKLIVSQCHKHSKPVVVDPKVVNAEGYHGVSYITPNIKEMLELAPGYLNPIEGAVAFSRRFHCAVLLTKGADGIALVRGGNFIAEWPAEAREVFDVSGAGDTVVAAFSLSLAAGASEEEAIAFANQAAAIVVGKHGTSTVSLEEIKRSKERD